MKAWVLGLSLLELLVYLSCSTLMLSLAGYSVFQMHCASRNRIATLERWTQAAIAMHKLLEDINMAPLNMRLWKKMEKFEFIFSLKGQDVGWLISKERLVRLTGTYNVYSSSWTSRGIAVILDSIEGLSFEFYLQENKVLGVRCSIMMPGTHEKISLNAFAACRGSDEHS